MSYIFKRPISAKPTLNELTGVSFTYNPDDPGIVNDQYELVYALGNQGFKIDPKSSNNKVAFDYSKGIYTFKANDLKDNHIDPFKGIQSIVHVATLNGNNSDTSQYRMHKSVIVSNTGFSRFYGRKVNDVSVYVDDDNTLRMQFTIKFVKTDFGPQTVSDYINEIAIYRGDLVGVLSYLNQIQDNHIKWPTKELLDAYPIVHISFDNIYFSTMPNTEVVFKFDIDAKAVAEVDSGDSQVEIVKIPEIRPQTSWVVEQNGIYKDALYKCKVDAITIPDVITDLFILENFQQIGSSSGGGSGGTSKFQRYEYTIMGTGSTSVFTGIEVPSDAFNFELLLNGLEQDPDDFVFDYANGILTTNLFNGIHPATTDEISLVYYRSV
jgi:hypothetical protein